MLLSMEGRKLIVEKALSVSATRYLLNSFIHYRYHLLEDLQVQAAPIVFHISKPEPISFVYSNKLGSASAMQSSKVKMRPRTVGKMEPVSFASESEMIR